MIPPGCRPRSSVGPAARFGSVSDRGGVARAVSDMLNLGEDLISI